jgi:hypothetical protein
MFRTIVVSFASRRTLRLVLIGCCVASASGCLHTRLADRLLSDLPGPRVAGLPPDYEPNRPRPAYSGPHPSALPFDTARFDFPVALGDVGPIDRSHGPLQYPFVCETIASGLGQPLVDNDDGAGVPVHAVGDNGKPTRTVVGYSKDCSVPTRVDYFYYSDRHDEFRPLVDGTAMPDDVTTIDYDGRPIPFVVALERGTINRFLYGIAMLADASQLSGRGDGRYWNRKLVYYFRGGVGIGKRQGRLRATGTLARRKEELTQGYAVAFSTGNQTAHHGNMWLAANTASMVKAHFSALYGEPRYTVGIGESGGAVQQYLLAQNRPGLLDALIPIYGYPDTATQTIWAMDCELLEYYFDVTAANQRRWRDQTERGLIVGLAASNDVDNPLNRYRRLARLLNGRWPGIPPGGTECAVAWRGLTPVANNPFYYHHAHYYAKDIARATRFSHWHDLADFYGVDDNGFAYRTYDNNGVQYGLDALRTGALTPAEFLHLNANIGSWREPRDMRPERLWVLSGDSRLRRLSPWSHHNMQRTPRGPNELRTFERGDPKRIRVAPRNRAHRPAVAAAYRSGHVFVGEIDLPIIDLRHYLDHEVDMHHSFASMATRLRIAAANGDSNNMLIWMAEPPFDPTRIALALIDSWLRTGRRPEAAVDRCWNRAGEVIAEGDNVWQGDWSGSSTTGACLDQFPIHQTPRNAAGAPRAGDLFQCRLIAVDQAIARGVYAPIDMAPHRPMLERIFPDGVCDYDLGDAGRPSDLVVHRPARGAPVPNVALEPDS